MGADTDSDHCCNENCLLGNEDWDDEAASNDTEQIEPQTPVVQLQELSELPALPAEGSDDESEDESLIDYRQTIARGRQTVEQATESAQTAQMAISGAASELSNQQGVEATEVTEELTEEIAEAVTAVRTEQPQAATLETSEECQQISEASPEPASTASTSISEVCVDAADSADDNGFSFPLADHTPRSMLNLINLIYTRGSLLSKATGGNFGVDKELITILNDDDEYESKEFLVDFIKEHVEEGARLDGISFSNTHITFTGFPTTQTATDRAGTIDVPPEKLEVFKRLAARMNKMAKEQKRIVPKEITEPNEKYALRIWLIRLGMNGADCKLDRKILLQNLSGHTAFRNEADKEKWIARQNAKKRKTHVAYEGPTGTTATELMATESTITTKEAL